MVDSAHNYVGIVYSSISTCMHAGSLAPFEVDLKLWPEEQCFEAAVSMLKCLGVEMTIANYRI